MILRYLLNTPQSLPADMLARIAEIVHYMQKRAYQRANDAYLRLSIGNAPWPIGVTMVGCVDFALVPRKCCSLTLQYSRTLRTRENITRSSCTCIK